MMLKLCGGCVLFQTMGSFEWHSLKIFQPTTLEGLPPPAMTVIRPLCHIPMRKQASIAFGVLAALIITCMVILWIHRQDHLGQQSAATCQEESVKDEVKFDRTIQEITELCTKRTGATDTDVQVWKAFLPLRTHTQKCLEHCHQQMSGMVCGNRLSSRAQVLEAYVFQCEGYMKKFENINQKINECYTKAKALDGTDGCEMSAALYECFRNQHLKDEEDF